MAVVDKDLFIVMNTIDEARDHMPEGKYLETCDALRRIHKKLRRPSIPHPTEMRIPITKKILFLLSALKIVEKVVKIVSKR
jgi:hypothetical protein